MTTYSSLNAFLKEYPQEGHLREIVGTSTHTRVIPADDLFLDEHFLLYITVVDDFYGDEVWRVNVYPQYNGASALCADFDSLNWALRELNALYDHDTLSVEALEDRGYIHEE